ncbi:hypothetical protein [Clostridium sp. LIBA-8841]|nr:hypothetical protein [Clostridium sp. LIBA-8841]MDZ5253415.1 hypothetical protein [Clostridium sp. LIBA-8841]
MNKNYNKKQRIDSTFPTSHNYNDKIKNKANEKTPYGSNEPSPRTTYK